MPAERSLTRRVLAWTGAVGAMALLVVGMASMKNGPDTREPEPPSAQLVAVVDGDVVILNADNGDVLNRLASGDAVDVAVSPDGLFAYFTRVEGSGECVAGEILRVPVGGGDEEVIATGSHPVVSPDAEQLAYEGTSPADVCPPIPELAVRDLESGDERRWAASSDSASALEPVAWAPDARVLGYRLQIAGGPSTDHLVDTQGAATSLPDGTANLVANTRLVHFESDGTLAVIDGDSIVLVDPASGMTERTLIDAGAPITNAWSDGLRVAYTTRTDDGLFVWTSGDDEPRHLDVDIEWAAWLP